MAGDRMGGGVAPRIRVPGPGRPGGTPPFRPESTLRPDQDRASDARCLLRRRESPMRFGKHEPRPSQSPRREGFRPRGERLEERQLLSIDLANVATTPPGPYGVLEAGLNNNGGAGFS